MACAIASIHAARDEERGGNCSCSHCAGECECDESAEDQDGYDDEAPLVDPEEIGQ